MSTKIETFKKERDQHEKMVSDAYKSLNIKDYKKGSRDKHGMSIGSTWHDHGEPMGHLTGYSGFYGDSGCQYQCSPRMRDYLLIVINKNMEKLVEEAILLSANDVEKKRLNAEQEAKDVLQSL